ncbi:endoglucanase-like [Macadamia integrifolia]|uniref:endoglucanase-like n=1 Tax=Macadamia integrifolia TaxID=60698 RepID=UPI001C529007|nr:endoglucanase-like [Macadamia integrifolia]
METLKALFFLLPLALSLILLNFNTPCEATEAVTKSPISTPTRAPTRVPTRAPTRVPTRTPTGAATRAPTGAATTAPHVDLITTACKRSVFKALCLNTLRSDTKSSKADLKGLAAIAIQNTVAVATNTSNHITVLLNATPTKNNLLNATSTRKNLGHPNAKATTTPGAADPFTHRCLSGCSKDYANVINQLNGSLAALGAGKYNDANLALSAAMATVELCEEGFSSQPGHFSVLKDINSKFNQLCSNALAITTHLAGSSV